MKKYSTKVYDVRIKFPDGRETYSFKRASEQEMLKLAGKIASAYKAEVQYIAL